MIQNKSAAKKPSNEVHLKNKAKKRNANFAGNLNFEFCFAGICASLEFFFRGTPCSSCLRLLGSVSASAHGRLVKKPKVAARNPLSGAPRYRVNLVI